MLVTVTQTLSVLFAICFAVRAARGVLWTFFDGGGLARPSEMVGQTFLDHVSAAACVAAAGGDPTLLLATAAFYVAAVAARRGVRAYRDRQTPK